MSVVKAPKKFFVRDPTLFAPRLRSSLYICLVLKCPHSTIIKVGRDHHGATTRTTRSNLNGFTLGRCNIVALAVTKLGEGHGSHATIVQLVLVAHKSLLYSCVT